MTSILRFSSSLRVEPVSAARISLGVLAMPGSCGELCELLFRAAGIPSRLDVRSLATFAEVAESPVDIVVCAFDDEDAFNAGMFGAGGLLLLALGARVLDFSHVSSSLFREAVGKAAEAGVTLLGADVVPAAAAGAPIVVVDNEVLSDEVCGRFFASVQWSVKSAGECGRSKTVTLLHRHLHAIVVAASAEAIGLGKAAGISESVLVPLLLKGSGSNAVLKGRGGAVQAQVAEGDVLGSIAALDDSRLLGRRLRHPTWFAPVASDALRRLAQCASGANAAQVTS